MKRKDGELIKLDIPVFKKPEAPAALPKTSALSKLKSQSSKDAGSSKTKKDKEEGKRKSALDEIMEEEERYIFQRKYGSGSVSIY